MAAETSGFTSEILIVILGAGGIAGAITAAINVWKAKPEKDKIVIDAVNGAVVIQSNVLDEVNAAYENVLRDNKELRDRIDELADLKNEVNRLTEENAELTSENTALRRDNQALREEVRVLTDRVQRLEGDKPN